MSSTVSPSATFIDLSTYAELEAFLYGGPYSITQFVGTVQKSNWFSIIPTALKLSQEPNFGSRNVSATINRSGDYVIKIWVRFTLPKVWLPGSIGLRPDATVRWVNYLGHNIFNRIYLLHNEITSQEMTSYWLDFNYQFNIPVDKRLIYKNMIGHVSKNITPVLPGVPLGTGSSINLPIPLWFCKDSGRALPIAALPFSSTTLNFDFRNLRELLIVSPGIGVGTEAQVTDVRTYPSITEIPTTIQNFETYAMYGVVHNDERVKMGDAPRDMLIQQIQQVQISPFKDVKDNASQSFDIRLSHSICSIYFAARNTSIGNSPKNSGVEQSNYTTEPLNTGTDPIGYVTLVYENTARLSMNSDYFSFIDPYYKAPAGPEETGYHMWSYALESDSLNPCGSTNYSKLANVSLRYSVSENAVLAAGSNSGIPINKDGDPIRWPINSTDSLDNLIQTFDHVCIAVNWNIVRIANGSCGFPTL
jgi:hypothetical protein